MNNIEWFKNVGNLFDVEFEFPIQLINEKKCNESINSITWENFCLDAINKLSRYLELNFKEEASNWNLVVRESKKSFESLKKDIEEKAILRGLSKEIIIDVNSNVIMYLVEDYFYKQIGDSVPIFFRNLMKIYESGHIACGWDGLIQKEKNEFLVDFNTGEILIW